MIIPNINIKITELKPHIFYAQFETQRDLSHCLMRLQEYYEGPSEVIRGKYFTLEEFLHFHTLTNGTFDYTYNWTGYNVPGHIVKEWHELFSNSREGLTYKESQFIEQLQNLTNLHDKWYLIAAEQGSEEQLVVKHEIAHARYYLDNDYFNAANKLLNEIPKDEYTSMFNSLKYMGYSDQFIADEIQAYLSTSKKVEIKYKFGILSPDTYNIIKKFRKLFKK